VIEQLFPGPRLIAEQVSAVFVNRLAPDPVIDTFNAAVALPPVFLSTNVFGADDDPGAIVPKSQLPGSKEIDGGLAAPAPEGTNSASRTTAVANSDDKRFKETAPFSTSEFRHQPQHPQVFGRPDPPTERGSLQGKADLENEPFVGIGSRPAVCGHTHAHAGAVLRHAHQGRHLAINNGTDDFHAVWTVELK
jgi:hypothetical protein